MGVRIKNTAEEAPKPDAPLPVIAEHVPKGLILTIIRTEANMVLSCPVKSYEEGWLMLYKHAEANWNSAHINHPCPVGRKLAIDQYFEAKKGKESYFMDYLEFGKWAVL